MSRLTCSRCRARDLDENSGCCDYCGYTTEPNDSTLAIPGWVTKHLAFRPWELREIRQANLDIQPVRIKAGETAASRSAGTVSELPVRRKARWRKSRRDFFPIVHNGTVEI